MFGLAMHLQIVLFGRFVVALVAGVRLFPGMRVLMTGQLVLAAETLAANVAHVPLNMLEENVLVTSRSEGEFFVAIFAREILFVFSYMNGVKVFPQTVHGIEPVADVATFDRAVELLADLFVLGVSHPEAVAFGLVMPPGGFPQRLAAFHAHVILGAGALGDLLLNSGFFFVIEKDLVGGRGVVGQHSGRVFALLFIGPEPGRSPGASLRSPAGGFLGVCAYREKPLVELKFNL